jgi:hypothetical protein
MVESRGFLRDPQGLKNVERRKRYADQRLCRLAERQGPPAPIESLSTESKIPRALRF